jgi:hypothetical protein
MYLVNIMILCPHSLCEWVLFDNVLGLTRKLLDQVFTVVAIVTVDYYRISVTDVTGCVSFVGATTLSFFPRS